MVINHTKRNRVLVLTAFSLIIFLYAFFELEFLSYTSIWIVSLFTLLINLLYGFTNNMKRLVLLIFTVFSTILFCLFIYTGVNEEPPSNVGGFSLLPTLLFLVSVPMVITSHLLLLLNLLLPHKQVSLAQK